jgi:hypothetical protein
VSTIDIAFVVLGVAVIVAIVSAQVRFERALRWGEHGHVQPKEVERYRQESRRG